jgi:uncharacterized protein YdeI (YjbR/CyaY-like superfamily)
MAKHERHPKDDLPIIPFADDAAWERWLEDNHAGSNGLWIKTAKKRTGIATVTHADALNTAICFGWIDGQRHPYDETYFLQRFTPRRPRSNWSQVNVKKAEELIAAQRMRPAGLAQIEAAKADGRWAAAYEPQSRATIPEDFQRALDSNPDAKAFFATLKGVNRYAFLYRIQNAKRPETRAKRIEQFVAMLAEHRTFHP